MAPPLPSVDAQVSLGPKTLPAPSSLSIPYPCPVPQVTPSSFVLVALPTPLSATGNWAMCPCLCSWLHVVCVPLIPGLPSRHRASASAPPQGPWSNIPTRLLVVNTEAVRMEGKKDSRSLEGRTRDSEVCPEGFSPPTAMEEHWHVMWLCTCGAFLHLCGGLTPCGP